MLQHAHLEGLAFDMDHQNCYTLLRSFFKDNYGIELTDYACPTNWWNYEMDLYSKLAQEEGFDIVHEHPRDWRPGDVIIMAVQAAVGNHCAVLLDNGRILHHVVGQLSAVTPYGGMWRNTTVAVYRHRGIPLQKAAENLVHVQEFLPPHVRRRLEDLQERRRAAAADAGGSGDE